MNVALVTTLERGGPLEHAVVLAQGLRGAGVGVRALCADAAAAERFSAVGATAEVLPIRRGLDLAGAAALRRSLQGADVVHAQDRRAALWTRLLPRPSRHAVRVQTVHGLPEPYLPPPAGRARPGWRAALAYRHVDAKLAWRADAVITPSRAMADQLVRRLGYPEGRLRVIPNGVRVLPLASSRGEAVGTLSVLEPVKDLVTFLRAAALVAERRPATRFLIFGTGSQEAELRRCAAQLGPQVDVALAGHVGSGEALSQLGVLVLTSLMENEPMGVLEAMAAGVAVVASAVGGVPHLAPHGTASLVAPGDANRFAAAIEQLLADSAMRERQVAAARHHVERNRGAEVMVARTVALYQELLDARRAR